jgi:predicted transposase YbfD/YdcC
MTSKHPIETLKSHFGKVEDPRASNSSHQLIDIIIIAICGLICGADNWTEIEAYGHAKEGWLHMFLLLPHGIPSHDTFGRVFAMISPSKFKESFMSCIDAIAEMIKGQIAIDGKVIRRSYDRRNGINALHMVSAWSCEHGLVLGQEKVRDKSNEILAIPTLLELLDIAGCIVTIDAIGCQKTIARTIIDSEGDYVLSLKKNHEKLYQIAESLFNNPDEIEATQCNYHKTVEKNHGRIEIRECWATNDEDYRKYISEETGNWKGLQSLVMVRAERRIDDESSSQTRFFISSLPPDAEQLLQSIRSHWEIENKLHWVLDMSFREDESRVRQGNATENLAIMRQLSLNLLKRETTAKCGIKAKRLKAGWDTKYLLKVISV